MVGDGNIFGLVDALGDVRRQIASLKAREAELRAAILEARPNGHVTGRDFMLEVRRQTRRRFNPKALPRHLQDDPRFWSVTHSQTVLTRPAPGSVRTGPAWEEGEVIEEF